MYKRQNEGLLDSDSTIATQTLTSSQTRLVDLPEQNSLGADPNFELLADNSLNFAQADELSIAPPREDF